MIFWGLKIPCRRENKQKEAESQEAGSKGMAENQIDKTFGNDNEDTGNSCARAL